MAFYRTLTLDPTQAGSADTSLYPLYFPGHADLATVANGGFVQSASGFDIVFCTDPNNPLSSKLPFERVWWTAATGAAEFWVQIPTLSHTSNTVIYLYFGDATITTDQQNVSGTWDSNFLGVYHFGTGASVVLTDSTSHGNNGTNNGSTAVAGQIGGAANFVAASSQTVNLGYGSALANPSFECWFKYTGAAATSNLMGGYNASHGPLLYAKVTTGGITGIAGQYIGVAAPILPLAVSNYAVQHYAASTSDTSSNETTFLDGSVITGGGGNTPLIGQNYQIGVGGLAGGANFFDGWIDEVRISNIVRPVSYLTATYNNTKTGSTFIAIGGRLTPGGGGVLITNPGMDGGMRPHLLGGCNA